MKYLLSLLIIQFFPLIVSAQSGPSLRTAVGRFVGIVNSIIPVLVALALLVFFWGLVRALAKGGSPEGINKGKQIMLWGILSLFIMISLWGIITFFQSTLFS